MGIFVHRQLCWENLEGGSFTGDCERDVKRLWKWSICLCRGCVRGTWLESSFTGDHERCEGGAPFVRTLRNLFKKHLETEHFFLQGLCKGTQRHLCKGGLGQYVYWTGNCIGLIFFSCVQFKGIVGLVSGHNTLRKHFYMMGLCEDLTCNSWKEFVVFPYIM